MFRPPSVILAALLSLPYHRNFASILGLVRKSTKNVNSESPTRKHMRKNAYTNKRMRRHTYAREKARTCRRTHASYNASSNARANARTHAYHVLPDGGFTLMVESSLLGFQFRIPPIFSFYSHIGLTRKSCQVLYFKSEIYTNVCQSLKMHLPNVAFFPGKSGSHFPA